MTTNQRGLPPDLIFEPDGHVSELCVTAVADGEIELVPQAALDHLDTCDACGDKLGQAALLAVTAHEVMREASAAKSPEAVALVAPAAIAPASVAPVSPRRSRRPLPIAAIAAALLLAMVTAGPALSEALGAAQQIVDAAIGWVPTLARVAVTVVWSGPSMGPWGVALKWISAVLFVTAGLSVARATSRRRNVVTAMEGGVR